MSVAATIVSLAPSVLGILSEIGIFGQSIDKTETWNKIVQQNDINAVEQAIRDLKPNFSFQSLNKDATRVEVFSVYAALAGANDTSARDIGRFVAYLEKQGWDHFKMEDTLAACKEALETGSVDSLFKQGKTVNWVNIDNYVTLNSNLRQKYRNHIETYMHADNIPDSENGFTNSINTEIAGVNWIVFVLLLGIAFGVIYKYYIKKG